MEIPRYAAVAGKGLKVVTSMTSAPGTGNRQIIGFPWVIIFFSPWGMVDKILDKGRGFPY